MRSAAFGLAACFAVGITGACLAQGLNATQKFTDTQIGFDIAGPYSNLTLTVSGPHGLHASVSSPSGSPLIDLRKLGTVDDGEYFYQLTAATDEKIPVRGALDNGRDGGPATSAPKSVSMSGHVQVKGGMIVKHDPAAREPASRQK